MTLWHQEWRQFCGSKCVRPGTSEADRLRWPVSECSCILIHCLSACLPVCVHRTGRQMTEQLTPNMKYVCVCDVQNRPGSPDWHRPLWMKITGGLSLNSALLFLAFRWQMLGYVQPRRFPPPPPPPADRAAAAPVAHLAVEAGLRRERARRGVAHLRAGVSDHGCMTWMGEEGELHRGAAPEVRRVCEEAANISADVTSPHRVQARRSRPPPTDGPVFSLTEVSRNQFHKQKPENLEDQQSAF